MLFRQHLFIIRISRHLAHHLAVTRHEAGVELSASSDDTELKREYPSGLAVTLILKSVTLAYFLFSLDLTVISTATPAITTQFDSLVDVGW